MEHINGITLFFSIIITWTIGLSPPLLIRYLLLRRPMLKWTAISTCVFFWLFNMILFISLGSQSSSHAVLYIIAWISYKIIGPKSPKKELTAQEKAKWGINEVKQPD